MKIKTTTIIFTLIKDSRKEKNILTLPKILIGNIYMYITPIDIRF